MNFRKAFPLSIRWALLFALAPFFPAPKAFVSAQSFRGSISGQVTDAHALPVADAKVVARNLGTSETREISAGGDGTFRFLELPAGEYEVSAVAAGFEEVRAPKVRVDVGVDTVANLALSKVKGQEQRVEVVESVPLVETASTTLSQVVDRQLSRNCPSTGATSANSLRSPRASPWKAPA
jgi:hypothetical protein